MTRSPPDVARRRERPGPSPGLHRQNTGESAPQGARAPRRRLRHRRSAGLARTGPSASGPDASGVIPCAPASPRRPVAALGALRAGPFDLERRWRRTPTPAGASVPIEPQPRSLRIEAFSGRVGVPSRTDASSMLRRAVVSRRRPVAVTANRRRMLASDGRTHREDPRAGRAHPRGPAPAFWVASALFNSKHVSDHRWSRAGPGLVVVPLVWGSLGYARRRASLKLGGRVRVQGRPLLSTVAVGPQASWPPPDRGRRR